MAYNFKNFREWAPDNLTKYYGYESHANGHEVADRFEDINVTETIKDCWRSACLVVVQRTNKRVVAGVVCLGVSLIIKTADVLFSHRYGTGSLVNLADFLVDPAGTGLLVWSFIQRHNSDKAYLDPTEDNEAVYKAACDLLHQVCHKVRPPQYNQKQSSRAATP